MRGIQRILIEEIANDPYARFYLRIAICVNYKVYYAQLILYFNAYRSSACPIKNNFEKCSLEIIFSNLNSSLVFVHNFYKLTIENVIGVDITNKKHSETETTVRKILMRERRTISNNFRNRTERRSISN